MVSRRKKNSEDGAAVERMSGGWTRTRRASGLVEWVCDHGVGHPDAPGARSVHGCDGCCSRKDFPPKLRRGAVCVTRTLKLRRTAALDAGDPARCSPQCGFLRRRWHSDLLVELYCELYRCFLDHGTGARCGDCVKDFGKGGRDE